MWVPSIFNSLMPIHLYAVALEVWCLFTHFMIFFSNHYNIMENLNHYNNVWSLRALENYEPALVRGAPSTPSTRARIGFGCRPLHLRLWCPSSLPLLDHPQRPEHPVEQKARRFKLSTVCSAKQCIYSAKQYICSFICSLHCGRSYNLTNWSSNLLTMHFVSWCGDIVEQGRLHHRTGECFWAMKSCRPASCNPGYTHNPSRPASVSRVHMIDSFFTRSAGCSFFFQKGSNFIKK